MADYDTPAAPDAETGSPMCPFCQQPPAILISPRQAVCGTDECPCFMWNPSLSVAENRRGSGVVDMSEEGFTDG